MFRNESVENKVIQRSVDSVALANPVYLLVDNAWGKRYRSILASEAHRSALLLAGNDLGLGSALDSLALALKFLGHLSGSFVFGFADLVLLVK